MPTKASDPVVTSPHTKTAMTPDPVATSLSTSPIMTPNTVTTPRHQTSFASLPREIRDEIDRLAIPHSCEMVVVVDPQPGSSSNYSILCPQASTSTYANEACAMLFKSNSFRFYVEDLPVMLGEDGISYGLNVMKAFILVPCDFIYVVSESHFDVKPWLRDILLDLPTDESMDELAGRISLLLECSALRRVAVNLWGYRSMLKREIGTISRAFKPLAEKLGRRLMFRLSLHPKNSGHERDLKELETVDWDEVWFPGEMSSNSEGDEQ